MICVCVMSQVLSETHAVHLGDHAVPHVFLVVHRGGTQPAAQPTAAVNSSNSYKAQHRCYPQTTHKSFLQELSTVTSSQWLWPSLLPRINLLSCSNDAQQVASGGSMQQCRALGRWVLLHHTVSPEQTHPPCNRPDKAQQCAL